MKATTGLYDAALGQRSNETSGKAILARQREGGVSTFVYMDNLAKAIAHAGRILVDLIPRIYDTERVVRVLGEDDADRFVRVNAAALTQEGPTVLNDLSAGKYDVTVSTAPSYSTKRAEAADSMMQFVRAVPGGGGADRRPCGQEHGQARRGTDRRAAQAGIARGVTGEGGGLNLMSRLYTNSGRSASYA